jgi:hypothetical protein
VVRLDRVSSNSLGALRGLQEHRQGTWTLTLIVIALIGIAVGDELAIAHPGDDATLGFTILQFRGVRHSSCSPRSSS